MEKKLTNKEIESIANNYRLENIIQSETPSGMRSRTFFLNTKNEELITKIYPPEYTRELITYQALISNRMKERGAPTPEILRNKEGFLVTPFQETNYIIMERLHGKSPKPKDKRTLKITFEGLYLAHNSLKKESIKDVPVAPEVRIDLGEQLSELKEYIRTDKMRDKRIIRYMGQIEEIYEKNKEKIERIKENKQLILGDYNLGSVLEENGKITGIIDFDRLHPGYKIFDIMHAIDNLYIDKTSNKKNMIERVGWNKLKESIGYYASQDPKIIQEIYMAPGMLQKLALTNIISTSNEEVRGELPPGYFDEKKEQYIRRLEIPTKLEKRIIEELEIGIINYKNI